MIWIRFDANKFAGKFYQKKKKEKKKDFVTDKNCSFPYKHKKVEKTADYNLIKQMASDSQN